MDILTASASELGRGIAAGKLDPIEIAEAYFGEIERSEYSADIYTCVTRERGMREAKSASKRAKNNERLGLYDGVPVSWKDLFDTKDIATEGGTKLLQGRVPDADCEVVRRATEAGMVCLGKTHLSELAFSGLGINPMTSTSPNRYDTQNAPGGSSSGAAASISYNLAPIAIGSDTGGSVRIPSSWNDLVGLKTTHGTVPLDGVIPLCSSFDTVGPLARSLEDASHMFAVLCGNEPSEISKPDIGSLKFLVCETNTLTNLEASQLRGFQNAIAALEKAGARIEHGPIPEFEEMVELGPLMFPYEAYAQWGEMIEASPEAVFAPVRDRFFSGKNVTPNEDAAARKRMMELRKMYQHRTSMYDGVLAPTTPIGPPNIQSLLADPELFWDTNLRALSNTRYGNMFGLCALSLPTSVRCSGLMVLGSPSSDLDLLRVGASVELVIR